MSEKVKKKKLTILDRIEKIGNALPHPATIFLILSVIMLFYRLFYQLKAYQ